jgi:hypothetical protein
MKRPFMWSLLAHGLLFCEDASAYTCIGQFPLPFQALFVTKTETLFSKLKDKLNFLQISM